MNRKNENIFCVHKKAQRESRSFLEEVLLQRKTLSNNKKQKKMNTKKMKKNEDRKEIEWQGEELS
jgi:hypothetical protein